MKKKANNSNITIHFIGIGGIGMSGIAEIMLDQGFSIQGSDIANNDNIKRLKKKGAKIFQNHKKSNIKNITAAVFSSAIKKTNPEIVECKKLFIPLVSRADMLAELMRGKNAIAIAGSHGKTTTTSLVGAIFEHAKLDPTIINGGIVINRFLKTEKNNRLGSGKWMVVEADESDGSFLKLPHEINIITNIDAEHLDYYKTEKKLFESFENFITNIPFYGYSIICIDNKYTKKLAKKIKTRNIITFGTSKNADVRIIYKGILGFTLYDRKKNFHLLIKKNVIPKFSPYFFGKETIGSSYLLGPFETNLMGHHNILNSTAAIIASLLVGISEEKIFYALKSFQGVRRRFTWLGDIKKSSLFDDYAHHPTEIKATYEIAKSLKESDIVSGVINETRKDELRVKWKNIIGVFQPHRFSRTKNLYNDFIEILKKFDVLYILDIYPAGEKSIKGVNSQRLVKDLKKKNSQVYYLKKNTNINKILSSHYNEENIIIFMGAGSITHEAHKIKTENKGLFGKFGKYNRAHL